MTTTGDEPQWHGETYAPHAAHHRALDAWFLDRHPPRPGDHVVDAGCGTGEFTARLADAVGHGRVTGVDPDRSMLEVAERQARAGLEFRRGRLQELDAVCGPGWADLVVSRATFHWIPLEEYPACYAAVWRTLAPGGWFHAESGGAGNVGRVAQLMDAVAADRGLAPTTVTFPDPGTVLELLEQAGFVVGAGGAGTVAQRRAFDADALEGFVRTQAAVAYLPGADRAAHEAFVAEVVGRLDELRRHDGTYDQTFVRLDVLAQRPG